MTDSPLRFPAPSELMHETAVEPPSVSATGSLHVSHDCAVRASPADADAAEVVVAKAAATPPKPQVP
ncbi:hypothetical protein ACU686_07465 [Yinghuangia aomiensis]